MQTNTVANTETYVVERLWWKGADDSRIPFGVVIIRADGVMRTATVPIHQKPSLTPLLPDDAPIVFNFVTQVIARSYESRLRAHKSPMRMQAYAKYPQLVAPHAIDIEIVECRLPAEPSLATDSALESHLRCWVPGREGPRPDYEFVRNLDVPVLNYTFAD